MHTRVRARAHLVSCNSPSRPPSHPPPSSPPPPPSYSPIYHLRSLTAFAFERHDDVTPTITRHQNYRAAIVVIITTVCPRYGGIEGVGRQWFVRFRQPDICMPDSFPSPFVGPAANSSTPTLINFPPFLLPAPPPPLPPWNAILTYLGENEKRKYIFRAARENIFKHLLQRVKRQRAVWNVLTKFHENQRRFYYDFIIAIVVKFESDNVYIIQKFKTNLINVLCIIN